MTAQEFREGMKILIEAYPGHPPGSHWPPARVAAFQKAFTNAPDGVFLNAVQDYMVNNFYPPTIHALRAITGTELKQIVDKSGVHMADILHPANPNAAELANKYAPGIKEKIKTMGALPYDKKKRIVGGERE